MIITNRQRRIKIKRRIAKKVRGVAKRPRLSVYKSNTKIYVQLIDDEKGHTLCALDSSVLGEKKKSFNIGDAKEFGLKVAEKCNAAGIKSIVFDRSGYRYHGNVKSLAEGAREGGLLF